MNAMNAMLRMNLNYFNYFQIVHYYIKEKIVLRNPVRILELLKNLVVRYKELMVVILDWSYQARVRLS